MKKTGALLYTMFFFLQNQALFSAKGFLFYKNTNKISEKQIVSSLFFHAVGASPFLFPHHQFARQRYNLLAFIPHPR